MKDRIKHAATFTIPTTGYVRARVVLGKVMFEAIALGEAGTEFTVEHGQGFVTLRSSDANLTEFHVEKIS